MYDPMYPSPVINGERVKFRHSSHANGSCSWFSPLGPIRGDDIFHIDCRRRYIPDGSRVKLGGEEYEFRNQIPEEQGLPEGILTWGLLQNGDVLEIVSTAPLEVAAG